MIIAITQHCYLHFRNIAHALAQNRAQSNVQIIIYFVEMCLAHDK